MPKPPKPPPAALDGDVPELDDAFFSRARRGDVALKPEFLAKAARGRPRLEAPKQPVSLRLDADVVRHLRAQGPGWQTRVNDLLAQAIASGRL